MSSEKRLILCVVLTFGFFVGGNLLLERLGLTPPPPPQKKVNDAPVVAKGDPDRARDKDKDAAKATEPGKADPGKLAITVAPEKDQPKLALDGELILGPAKTDSESPYRLQVFFDQRGAVVSRASSTIFDAEYDPNDRKKKPGKLDLILANPKSSAPGSLAIILSSSSRADKDAEARKVEAELDLKVWEVVRDKEDGPAVRPTTKTDPTTGAKIEGQTLAFRIKVEEPPVIVTKTFRLFPNEDGFEVDLKFEAPTKRRPVQLQDLRPARHPDRGGVVHLDLPRRLLRRGQG